MDIKHQQSRQICQKSMHIISLLVFLLAVLIKTATINNCITYASSSAAQKLICQECRVGFYIKNGTCVQCVSEATATECKSINAVIFGSNIASIASTIDPALASSSKFTSNTTNTTAKTNSTSVPTGTSASQTSNSSPNTQNTTFFPNIQTAATNSIQNNNQNIQLNIKSIASTQNCKEINTAGKCIACFTNFTLDTNGLCVKQDNTANQKKLVNCSVYSEVSKQCLLCSDGYKLNTDGICVIGSGKTTIKLLPTSMDSTNTTKSAQKPAEQAFVLQLTPLNSLISDNKPLSISLTSPQHSSHLPLEPITPKEQPQVSPPKIKIQIQNNPSNTNTSIVVKLQNCSQYIQKNGTKICSKCMDGYIINILINSCVKLNKGIQLNKNTKNEEINNTNNDHNQKNTTMIDPNINKANITNTSADNKTNTTTNNKTNTTTGITTGTTTNTTTNNSISTTSPIITISPSNTANPTVYNQPLKSNITNTTVNTTNTTQYNVTTKIDSRTGAVITIIGTTVNPPATKKLPNCVKYRDITYECVECQSTYQLYSNKCYDAISYRNIVKNSFTAYGTTGFANNL